MTKQNEYERHCKEAQETWEKKIALLQRGPMPHDHFLSIDVDRRRRERREGPAVQVQADLEQMHGKLTLGERLQAGHTLMQLAQELLAQHPTCWRTSQCDRPAEFQVVRYENDGKALRRDRPRHLYSCNYCLGFLLRDLTLKHKMKTFDVNPIMEAL